MHICPPPPHSLHLFNGATPLAYDNASILPLPQIWTSGNSAGIFYILWPKAKISLKYTRQSCIFPMFPRRFQDPKTGFHLLSSMRAKKYLNKIGVEREDYDYLKQIGKALLCSYTILGALYFYNGGTSPLEWLKQKTRLNEEIELAHLYPGDGESMKEFIDKMERMIGKTGGTKGMVESDKEACKRPEELPAEKIDQDAQKLWLKMRNEVISELREKGYDVK